MNTKNQNLISWEQEKQRLARLNLNVPPLFEKTLGYLGEARFIAFFCHLPEDQLFYHDGRVTQIGDYQAWQLWLQCHTNASELWSYDFGKSGKAARHWLMIDRDERDFYVGNAEQIERFLISLPGDMRTSLAWLLRRKRLFGRQRIRQPLTARRKIIEQN